MKCVARKRCQARDANGRVITYSRGAVEDFVICPTHFRPIEGEDAMPLDFDNAQELELLESEFDLDELKDYIRNKYDKNPGNRGKRKTVAMLLDCRYRSINVDLDKLV